MKSVLATLRLFRPVNLLLGAMMVTVTAALVDALNQTDLLMKGIFVVMSFTAAANAFNDYRDLETDKINRTNRPLPRGDLAPETALILSILLFMIGTGISFTINTGAFIIAAVVALPLMVVYSLWLKGTILIGNMIVAVIIGLSFVFAGALFGELDRMIMPSLLAFGFTMVREFIKDMADADGDRAAGFITFPVKFGIEKSARIAIFLTVLLMALLVAPYFMNIYSEKYLVAAFLGIGIPLSYIISLLVKSPSSNNCHTASQILKASVFLGLLAVYLG